MIRQLLSIALASVMVMPTALAAGPSADACAARMTTELTKVHDEYRGHVFGSRRDTDGKNTVLTGGTSATPLKGIFETKGRLTSELVAPLVESYRMLRCQSVTVCQAVRESLTKKGGTVTLQPLGCPEQKIPRYEECYFAGDETQTADSQAATVQMVEVCGTVVEETLTGERAVLRLSAGYDSGYRSMLQTSGIVDWMLRGFPTEAVKAVSGMVNLLGKLHQIPCFIGQCDLPKTSSL